MLFILTLFMIESYNMICIATIILLSNGHSNKNILDNQAKCCQNQSVMILFHYFNILSIYITFSRILLYNMICIATIFLRKNDLSNKNTFENHENIIIRMNIFFYWTTSFKCFLHIYTSNDYII